MSKPKDVAADSESVKKKALTDAQLDKASGAGAPAFKPPEERLLEALAAERNKR